MADQSLLHGMQHRPLCKILDGNEFGPVKLAQQMDTGIDGMIDKLAGVMARQNHGAGTAIAFRTPFFGSGCPFFKTQPVQNGGMGIKRLDFNETSAP